MFVIVLDVINEVWRDCIPSELSFADDLALMAESEAGLQESIGNGRRICWKNVSKSIAKILKSFLAAKKRQERVSGTMKLTLS